MGPFGENVHNGGKGGNVPVYDLNPLWSNHAPKNGRISHQDAFLRDFLVNMGRGGRRGQWPEY